MRSKNNRRKPASRRQGRLALIIKRIVIFTSIAVAAVSVVSGAYFLAQAFYVRGLQVYGSSHLDKRDIESILDIDGKQLLYLSLKDIDSKLKGSAWIKNTSLRWRLPGTLVINIEEAAPKALLDFGGKTLLVNEDGDVMEELQDAATPFLPVIKGIDPRYKKEMSEAMKLVEALVAKNILADRQYVEVGLESYGLTANIDGELVKVGYGRYSEKFDKWTELEPELRKRGVPIQYVDLRFKDSVIVKPVKPVKESKDKKKEKKI
ncbi:MAG: FtsQ-type POTRA domain-containing protein [Nitrospirae bacterium]|nr:FtsQ-type POTRA domain-containing protein [Nitrospirota bacterium]